MHHEELSTEGYSQGNSELPSSGAVRGTVRAILAPLLLAGAVALPAGTAFVDDAHDPQKEQKGQKDEDPKITTMRADIQKLIADLDSGNYVVRDKAHKALERMAVQWVQTRQKPFPLISLLQTKNGYSLEQQRRLEQVIEVHDAEAVELLWLPTKFQEPALWRGRKESPQMSDVLKELGRQTGQEFNLCTTGERFGKSIEDFPVCGTFDGRTFWGILEELQKWTKQPLDIRRVGDDSLRVSPYWNGSWNTIASQGSVGANFMIDPAARRAWLVIDAEPRLRVGQYHVVEVVGKTDTGVPFEPYEPVRGGGMPGNTGIAPCFAIPHMPGAKTADLRFTVEVEAYKPKTVPIVDIKKAQCIKSSAFTFDYLNMEVMAERWRDEKKVWFVNGTSEVGYRGMDLFHLVRCKAFDSKNHPIRFRRGGGAASVGGGPVDYAWEFEGEPHRIEYSVPERSTRRTLTF